MISIIGSGNVATHLFKALGGKTQVELIEPHSLKGLNLNSELIILAVADEAISQILPKLKETSSIIVHTSGSVDMECLKEKNREYGVLYPLQTFSKNLEMNYDDIPFFIEASSPSVEDKLKDIASLITKNVRYANSQARKQLHLASVFACNFTNALAGVAKELLSETDIEFSVFMPLLRQTVEKLKYLSPKEAQTGPAIRNDRKIIRAHLDMLGKEPELKALYELLTKRIQHEKL
ncbi:MAG: DUF2520 domain-containing protein [Muribaculaceae bacterium]|nr:DUF2520 domain-containing protein [Muribaculaceae bacterium]